MGYLCTGFLVFRARAVTDATSIPFQLRAELLRADSRCPRVQSTPSATTEHFRRANEYEFSVPWAQGTQMPSSLVTTDQHLAQAWHLLSTHPN